MTTLPALTGFTPLQGGVPIVVDGQVVGAIGVSGAASAQQDDDIATAAAEAFAANARKRAEVSHFDSRKVQAAFRSGDTLLATSAYTVNASRRDGPGEAEIHQHDTDIFYVLEGTASFVTGGELVEPRNIGPGEIRGSSIRGGRSQKLAKGDVITIPAGVPHWFEKVSGPFVYYVVKSSEG